jgi:quinoprotein glucose dehydrogenase
MVVDGVMYVAGKDSVIFVLDAAAGKQIWSHASTARRPIAPSTTGRARIAPTAASSSLPTATCAAPLLPDPFIQEINLRTGVTIPTFGKDGRVDLRESLGRDPQTIRSIQSGTPGRVFENKSSSARSRAKESAPLAATSALTPRSRASWSGRSTRSRIPANSAATRGPRTPGSI